MDIGFSDDGEPSGTAGKPILAQLQGTGFGEICAVVTRYFGGIKLGTGGLVKAYGGSVQKALKQLESKTKQLTTALVLRFDYSVQNSVEQILAGVGASLIEQEYSVDICLKVAIPNAELVSVKQQLMERTKGQVRIAGQSCQTGL